MTRPTQAQIEAAAEAMMRDMFAPHELPLDDELRRKYLHTATAALTAAAEVGGPMQIRDARNFIAIRKDTIERCAQAIKDHPNMTDRSKDQAIAAIRALKDSK